MNHKGLYEKHYGIKLTPEYDVHHIDFNHQNNDIRNLIVLPKRLHRRLHQIHLSACVMIDGLFEFSRIARPFCGLGGLKEEVVAAIDLYEMIQPWSWAKMCEDEHLAGEELNPYYNYSMFRR